MRDNRRPDEGSSDGELVDRAQQGDDTALGLFSYASLQLRRHWNVGALVDFVELPDGTGRDRAGAGVFAGYSLFEESTVLRALVRRDELPDGAEETGVQVQVVFGLGPHKPHEF